MSLLTLSLNAQVANSAHKFKAGHKIHLTDNSKGQPLVEGKCLDAAPLVVKGKNGQPLRSPAKVNTADGEFLVGPYTTDDFSTTGKGLYNSTFSYPSGRIDITAVLDRSEIEQYIGQEIVGYRFATTGTVSCYSFVISIEGPNHWVDDLHVFNIQSSGSYVDVTGTQWHEYYLNEPVTFEIPDSTIAVWIGYKYYQETSSNYGYTATPILVNPNSTSHDTYAYSYGNEAFYDVTSHLGGDLAAQLIFKTTMEKTASPTITVTPGAEYYTVTATGDGTVTLTVGGQTATGQGSASINVPVTPDDQALTATATAQEEGKRVSDPATQAVNIPGAGRTPMPTINYVWNGDECTITATGNGEVHMYVDGNEVTQPYVVEKGATQKTIVVTATAQEEGLAISNTATQSIVIPAMNTSDFTQLPGTYTANQPIDMSKMIFCDRFSVSTATNSHPYQYDYVMKENTGEKRSTNTVEVPVQHTGSKVMPYYSLDSVNADVDRHHVTPYVLNASQEIYMSPSSKIFFYTLQRGRAVNTIPTQYFSVMQRQPSGDYKEMQDPSTNFGQEVAPGDYYNCLDDGKRFTGTYDVDYMAYVPVVWTYGYDRVGYNPDNPVHNSYGAPIWKTGAPQVRTIYLEAQMQRGPLGSTQWEDANGNPCSLYFLGVEAYGDVPSANVTNIKCEPYMFRVWIESPSGKLRGCSFVEADPQRPVKPGEHWEGDGTSYTGPVCVYEGLTTDGHLYNRLQSMEEGNNQSWTEKIKFGAVDNIDDLQVYIRFYYKSDGEAIENPTSNGMRGNRDGGEGYGAGDGGGAPGISTSIKGVYTDADHGEIVSQTYINPQGMTSDKPFNGVNIVITNYSDGSKTTTKVIR